MRVSASISQGIESRYQPKRAQPAAAPETVANLPAVIAAHPRNEEKRPRFRPLAGVLAQLAATAADNPSTRARRRAEPNEAANAYAVAPAAQPSHKKTICIV